MLQITEETAVSVTNEPAGRELALSRTIPKVKDALALWLAGFASQNTRRAYEREMRAFTEFAEREDVAEALAAFLALNDAQAHAVADKWRADKIARGLSPSTVNRSMAALNSFVTSARRHGLTKLRLEAKGLKREAYRDTKGPGVHGVRKLIRAAEEHPSPRKAARDRAIMKLAFALGLRRGEIAELNIGHVNLEAGTVSVLGKGKLERVSLTLPPNVKKALADWLEVRGTDEATAPLFCSLTRNLPEERLSGWGVWHLVREQIGRKAGVTTRPHGLRHAAITAALDAFNGDFRKVRSFSRHASLDIIRVYDDNRADHAGQVAQTLDGLAD